MSLNSSLSSNMVESPRIQIDKRNFEQVTSYLRNVKWWGMTNDSEKKYYLATCLTSECKREFLDLENIKELTLRQVIGRLKRKFHIDNLCEDAYQAGIEKETKRILGFITDFHFDQGEDEELYNLWSEYIKDIKISFNSKKIILAALCSKDYKRYIWWHRLENESQIARELQYVDTIEKKKIHKREENLRKEKEEENLRKEKEETKILKEKQEKEKINNEYKEIIMEKTELICKLEKENHKYLEEIEKEKYKVQQIRTEFKKLKDIIQNSNSENTNKVKVKKTSKIQECPPKKHEEEISATKEAQEIKKGINEEYLCNSYSDVTDLDKENSGYIGEECAIPTEKNQMVVAKPLCIKKGMEREVMAEIQNLLNKGYITESSSEWNNIIRPVLKSNNSIRLCMNMMALNEISITDSYPLPDLENIIDAMQGNKVFSVIDLCEGYFQIRLKSEDCHKTAFTINQKKFEWKRMPMGYKNSPAFFQRIME
ncbi:hypothetical protein ENBRE01_1662 [Enteropsectra breve]|nr:hypothetical protein ENBRE01_1662 [Enteropsectra breve]